MVGVVSVGVFFFQYPAYDPVSKQIHVAIKRFGEVANQFEIVGIVLETDIRKGVLFVHLVADWIEHLLEDMVEV